MSHRKRHIFWLVFASIIVIGVGAIGLLTSPEPWNVNRLRRTAQRILLSHHTESYRDLLLDLLTGELERFPQEYNDEAAEEDGVVSIRQGTMHGATRSVFDIFVADTSEGRAAQIVIAAYTANGDPIYTGVLFDGEQYFAVVDGSRDNSNADDGELQRLRYDYLKTFTSPETGSHFVVLTNNHGLTFDMLREAQVASDMESIDSYQLFSYSE